MEAPNANRIQIRFSGWAMFLALSVLPVGSKGVEPERSPKSLLQLLTVDATLVAASLPMVINNVQVVYYVHNPSDKTITVDADFFACQNLWVKDKQGKELGQLGSLPPADPGPVTIIKPGQRAEFIGRFPDSAFGTRNFGFAKPGIYTITRNDLKMTPLRITISSVRGDSLRVQLAEP